MRRDRTDLEPSSTPSTESEGRLGEESIEDAGTFSTSVVPEPEGPGEMEGSESTAGADTGESRSGEEVRGEDKCPEASSAPSAGFTHPVPTTGCELRIAPIFTPPDATTGLILAVSWSAALIRQLDV